MISQPPGGAESIEDFVARVQAGGLVQAGDQLPESYRQQALRIASFQTLAELVGVLLFSEWLDRVPAFVRKQMLIAKIQDEVGHGHIMARVAEDLGGSRMAILEDYLAGKTRLLNIFHYDFLVWPEIAIGALLQNTAAIVQFQYLVKGSYVPYVRALRKILPEESFHFHQARNLVQTLLAQRDTLIRRQIEEGLVLWFPRVLAYFGPSEGEQFQTNKAFQFRLKTASNEEVRQAWLTKIVPVLESLGLQIPDPCLKRNDESGAWEYTEPDWNEVRRVIAGHGPASAHRLEQVRGIYERNRWLTEIMGIGESNGKPGF
ncbi:MAG: 1,2-phenylacetyl-CoA epoxidase subunit A [Ktedonobacteraceae bacterium]|nr:1,2-phenylacetyl-CoA epoxidase subunit A [Ktedonobacteraceae bacterium]